MRQQFILAHALARAGAILAVQNAQEGTVVELRERTRTLEQNAKLWAMLTDVSRQVNWHGQKLTQENWKDVFSAAIKRQQVVPGLDGGFVVLGQKTSKMTKREFSELVELIYAFGAEHSVEWSEPVEDWR